MPVVQVSQNTQPYHVDDFGDECERSCKGALHFLPASTKVITKSELEHVQKAHKGFASKLRVVPVDETKTRVALAAAKAKKAAPVAERASHRPSKAQRKAAGTKPPKEAKPSKEDTQPSMEPMVLAAEERKLATVDSKSKDKKKDKGK